MCSNLEALNSVSEFQGPQGKGNLRSATRRPSTVVKSMPSYAMSNGAEDWEASSCRNTDQNERAREDLQEKVLAARPLEQRTRRCFALTARQAASTPPMARAGHSKGYALEPAIGSRQCGVPAETIASSATTKRFMAPLGGQGALSPALYLLFQKG